MIRNLTPLHGDYRILESFDVKAKYGGKLSLKVVVFKDFKGMEDFTDEIIYSGMGTGLHPKTAAIVSRLDSKVERYDDQGNLSESFLEVDKNYFAAMCLIKDRINLEVLAHECVHAGYAYAKRTGKAYDERALDLDEENVAYPTGYLFTEIASEFILRNIPFGLV